MLEFFMVVILILPKVGLDLYYIEWGTCRENVQQQEKLPISEFNEIKEVFLADVAAIAAMRNIPSDLIFNLGCLLFQLGTGRCTKQEPKWYQLR